MKQLLIGLGILLIIVLSVAGIYNNLVQTKLSYETQWGQVENQLQRRFDLIPNLVSSVKGMMKQEQAVFNYIADARTKYAGTSNSDVNSKIAAASEMEGAIGRLLLIMENYPELKSSQNVTGLMDELAGTENRIAVERNRYNETVKQYNIVVKKFPTNVFANMWGFQPAVLFEAVESSNVAPNVEF
jgi:LemA protein